MKNLNERLTLLQDKISQKHEPLRIMIIGLGSVGLYLLDYIVSMSNPNIEIIVVGRNSDKMQSDVNIVKTAASIRRQLKSPIFIESGCNLENIPAITDAIGKWNPDFIVNTSRVYSGLKYGSISWSNIRAYGIWTPLSVKFAKNIIQAHSDADSDAITINTSYSDAVIPWLKSAGMNFYDFGSGNLNHLIPRMKFYISKKNAIRNFEDIDISLAASHFHDVVISKEGHAENQDILLDIKYQGEALDFDKKDLLANCSIPMPTDQKRNMMNASSNFDIISSIITALGEKKKIKIHSPGVTGEIGGYPFMIDGSGNTKGYIDESVFSLEKMRKANMESIYLDGIEGIENGTLRYTPELIAKVKKAFNVDLPASVALADADKTADFLIRNIIRQSF